MKVYSLAQRPNAGPISDFDIGPKRCDNIFCAQGQYFKGGSISSRKETSKPRAYPTNERRDVIALQLYQNLSKNGITKQKPLAGHLLLLRFFMRSVRSARVAVFIELNFTLNKLFILASPVINALALLAGEFDKLVL